MIRRIWCWWRGGHTWRTSGRCWNENVYWTDSRCTKCPATKREHGIHYLGFKMGVDD